MMHRSRRSVAAGVASLALVSAAATAPFAIADQPSTSPKGPKTTTTATTTAPTTTTTTTPAPPATPTPAEKKRGYGVLCKDQSKKHVAGQKGTPFSQCVTALAKVDRKPSTPAKEACKALSKKHVKGQKRTPYSQCVTAVAKQRKVTAAAS